MSGSHVEAVVVLEKDRPLRGVDGGDEALGLDHEVPRVLLGWLEWLIFGELVLLLFLL